VFDNDIALFPNRREVDTAIPLPEFREVDEKSIHLVIA
jgi:hypothetical protein